MILHVQETLAQVFFCEFCEISKNTFFTKHLGMTASVHLMPVVQASPRTKMIDTVLITRGYI